MLKTCSSRIFWVIVFGVEKGWPCLLILNYMLNIQLPLWNSAQDRGMGRRRQHYGDSLLVGSGKMAMTQST